MFPVDEQSAPEYWLLHLRQDPDFGLKKKLRSQIPQEPLPISEVSPMAESHAAQNDAPAAEKVPRAHSTHPADPVKPAEVPLGHSEQRLLPARLENLPTEQAVQLPLPVTSEAKPTVQFVHSDAAVPENLPGAQSEQFTARPGLKLPASHAEQVVAFSRLSVLKPAAQSRHAPVSATGAYFPAGQLLQLTVDAFTNWPAPHVSQKNRSDELTFPAAHAAQSIASSCRVASVARSSLNVPAGQLLQLVVPAASATFP